MRRIVAAALSITLLSSAVFAAQSNPAADDEDSVVSSTIPKKVDMRAGQAGNLPASLAGKKVITVEKLQDAAGAAGTTGGNANVIVVEQPGQKVGKYLPSNRNANNNTAQIPGVGGGVIVEDSLEGSGKKTHKNINQRSNEVLGDSF